MSGSAGRLQPPANDPPLVSTGGQHSQAWNAYFQDVADELVGLREQVSDAGRGVTDGSDAAAGQVGEYLTASRASSSPLPLIAGALANVTSLDLTPGDWDVWGSVGFLPAGTTVVRSLQAWVNTASATQPADGLLSVLQFSATGAAAGGAQILVAPQRRMSLGAAGTAYLGTVTSFTTAAMSAYGIIAARRVR
jgi:hypothetical protein